MIDPSIQNVINSQQDAMQSQALINQGDPYETQGTMQLSQFGSQDPRIIEKILDMAETLLEKLEHDLRGEQYNADNDKWEGTRKPSLNKDGVDTLMSLLKIPLNPINSLSVYDEETILKKCKLFHLHITYLITQHQKEWGIDIKNRSYLIHAIAGLYQSILMMSKNGKYLNSLSNTFQTKEISRFGQEQQQPAGNPFSGIRRRFRSWGL